MKGFLLIGFGLLAMLLQDPWPLGLCGTCAVIAGIMIVVVLAIDQSEARRQTRLEDDEEYGRYLALTQEITNERAFRSRLFPGEEVPFEDVLAAHRESFRLN